MRYFVRFNTCITCISPAILPTPSDPRREERDARFETSMLAKGASVAPLLIFRTLKIYEVLQYSVCRCVLCDMLPLLPPAGLWFQEPYRRCFIPALRTRLPSVEIFTVLHHHISHMQREPVDEVSALQKSSDEHFAVVVATAAGVTAFHDVSTLLLTTFTLHLKCFR